MRVSTEQSPAGPRLRRLRWSRRSSIRTRVLAIALVPSAALLITGASATGILVSDGISARDFAGYLADANVPLTQFADVTQQERTTSLRVLGGDQQAAAELSAQRDETNAVLAHIAELTPVVQKLNPDAVTQSNGAFAQLAGQLRLIRQGVDMRQAKPADVDAFFTALGGVLVTGLEGAARTSPDPVTAGETLTTTDLFWASDEHSRLAGLAAGAAARGVLSPADRLTVAQLAGAYRNQLNAMTTRLTGAEKARHDNLVGSDAWRIATAGEDSLAERGVLDGPTADWLAAEDHVSTELLGLWSDHFQHAETVAQDGASRTLWQSVVAGSLVLVLAASAFFVALRLANAVVRRLRRLRTGTLELAENKLPSMARRIADGESVDIEAEMTVLDDGEDEIGEVAKAFNAAKQAAFESAAAEARTRGGLRNVFLDIAHRSQMVVHRMLEVLDVAEAKQSDPEHLERLFQLDHLATAARRNAENLVILGGGQPGRKWRKPVALEDIVRSAVSESEDFARVSAIRLPEVKVLGSAVADLLHLLAELVDNATSFSPPDAPVSVRGNLVGKGVVVEVEDQGLGLGFDEREQLNETLRNPPDFQEMALAGQRHLGLFVVGQLARRHGISVSLLESAYGGVKAIVLIPTKMLESDQTGQDGPGDGATIDSQDRAARHRRAPSFVPRPTRDPVPPLPHEEERDLMRQWPTEEPPAEPSGAEFPPSSPSIPAVKPTRSRPALPRRTRQSHLAPQLRLDSQISMKNSAPRRLRSPDEARNAMSSFQRGTRQARDTSNGKHNR